MCCYVRTVVTVVLRMAMMIQCSMNSILTRSDSVVRVSLATHVVTQPTCSCSCSCSLAHFGCDEVAVKIVYDVMQSS